MGRVISKGNEAKSKMKHPSDMPTPRFNLSDGDLWSNALPTRPWRHPENDIRHSTKAEGHRIVDVLNIIDNLPLPDQIHRILLILLLPLVFSLLLLPPLQLLHLRGPPSPQVPRQQQHV